MSTRRARVRELLQANNREVGRRRVLRTGAEKALALLTENDVWGAARVLDRVLVKDGRLSRND